MNSVGFVGGGKMAEALASGILAKGLVTADRVTVCELLADRRQYLADKLGVTTSEDNAAVADAEVVVIAVKPNAVAIVLEGLRGCVRPDQLVVSIAAGVTIATLEAGLPEGTRIVRVMPNTPCLVGEGAAGFACGSAATDADAAVVEEMLGAVGRAFRLDEKLIDAVTGLSGSGPAYVYLMVEALADGGVLKGLPRDVAQALAAQTLAGAAKMVLGSGMHPGALKDAVMSPGGTTAEGINVLEQRGLRAALIAAVAAATEKSQALGAK